MSRSLEDAPLFNDLRRKRKWFKARTDSTRRVTHTMQCGGSLSVPHDELPDLYTVLHEELMRESKGTQFFLSELHSSVFPMYYDIDLKGKSLDKLPDIELKKPRARPSPGGDCPASTPGEPENKHPAIWQCLLATLQADVRRFFSDAAKRAHPRLFDAIVCTIDGTDLSGVHVYFPNLLVDEDKARIIRYSLVCQLTHTNRDLAAWDTVIDEQVYSTGLRLPGSKKLDKCAVCLGRGGAVSAGCPGQCDALGRQCVGRQYKFTHFLSDVQDAQSERYRDSYATNWCSLLTATSIRRSDAARVSEGFATYKGCPIFTKSKKQRSSGSKIDLQRPHEAYAAMERQIRRLNPAYRELDVDRIQLYQHPTTQKVTSAIVNVAGFNATYCPNKGGNHNSSRVWFFVTPNSIEVRCSCKKNTTEGRVHGVVCSKFKSLKMPLNTTLRDMLFPLAKYDAAIRGGNTYCGFSYTAPVTPAMTPGSITLLERITRNSEPATQITTPHSLEFADDSDLDEQDEPAVTQPPRARKGSMSLAMPVMHAATSTGFNVMQHAQSLDRELAILEAARSRVSSKPATRKRAAH